MMFHYSIDPNSDTPIYRQLVDQINAQIRSGALKTGTQLPTVREMADMLHLSCGTVKHVYDCLQKMGDIEMTRRRGTFVKYVRSDRDSRKQQAMNAIDHMIRKLSELNFSPAEIQIFLNLKMREWGLKWSGLRVTVVTDYPELSPALEHQLGQMPNVQVNLCTMKQLREYPYSVDEQSDVILASAADGQKLAMLLPDSDKLIRVALRARESSVVALSEIKAGRVAVLCEEDGALIQLVKRYLPESVQSGAIVLTGGCERLEEADVLVAAQGAVEKAMPQVQERIAQFALKRPVVTFACELDEGSMLYLEERIARLRDERQLWPNALRF